MAQNLKRTKLDTPTTKKRSFSVDLDGDAVGRSAESIARFLGTGKYLAYQTIIVVVWVLLNIGAFAWSWDPYPFILLNLAFSTQAAYAAPLILLAQNRQDDRDRVSLEEDRRRAAETKADTEFLARELAGLRLAVNDTVTRDYLRKELEDLNDLLTRIDDKLDDHRADESSLRPEEEHGGSRGSSQ
ncbi:DUF1003 domain-containing protein [Corynebacterium sp. 320]|uniref:DUF1003 domain-containing protein n=1 Tax=Corynebacterium zhongnanshanii TaxID=2768834 RepID=A0ABQ6VFV2_9CORY|nr:MULTISPECIES: DUF1003 domain-containing protein [Corynebacterium]KAB1503968.1 DUF1003 domain-containing protein [Corynebacterium sp. 320]KAB1552933.1 DUF1003 domain-containing protein [Corynebacterium sp. 321]KAB1553847.1 DUF1003 domain-containing protein [Corynebacterium sp. 319]KAB3523183.1 DUF1003 domain-containing protein [Corynebacterium zhongnanshanii]KAB3528104.1 DUF1003 domain-containing protein [Corynebacterium sp. 250]